MSTMELDPLHEDQLRKMATPSRMGIYVSKDILGFQWEAPKHILYMEQRILDAVLDEKKQRFISISMPPRHGKSFYCSVLLAAWFLGMNPGKRVILVTYSADFATKWGRAVRDILTRHGRELFGTTVNNSANSTTDWQMESSMGGMIAVGIEGGITGQGGDLIIIDDLIKNMEEAASVARKDAHFAEYSGSIRSRLEPGGTIVNIATRWAVDDLPGRLHEPSERGDQWEFVDFPALAEVPLDWEDDFEAWEDELGRKVHQVEYENPETGALEIEWAGDPLWPGRWDSGTLEQIKHSLIDSGQSLIWHALYQAAPRISEDASFPEEAWGRYPVWEKDALMKTCMRLVRSWDLAASKKKGDWTVGTLMGLGQDRKVYVFDVVRFREGPTEVEKRVIETAMQDGQGVKILIEQEKSGSGNTVTAHYERELLAYEVEGVPPKGDKEERTSIYAAKQGSGLVMLPSEAPWVKDWIDEHKNFGYVRHDDQVDTGSQGFNELAKMGTGVTIWSPAGLNFRAEQVLREIFQRVA